MDQQVSELPDDVLIDILRRLPVKPLAKLKLVCSSWYHIISNVCLPKQCPPSSAAEFSGYIFFTFPSEPHRVFFGFGHTKWHMYNSTLAMVSLNYGSVCLPYDEKALQFQDCCNGLLLLSRSSGEYLVFNPTTRECLTVPVQNRPPVLSAALAFDPFCSVNYKVVCFTRSLFEASSSSPPALDVFCSESGEWSSHDIPLDPCFYGFNCVNRFIYCNDALYCLFPEKFILCINLRCLCGAMDGDREAYAIALPDNLTDSCGFLGTSCGCLYFSSYARNFVNFWVLDKGSEFVLKHSLKFRDLWKHPRVRVAYRKYDYPNKFEPLRPYAVDRLHNDCEVIFGTPAFMIRYNLSTREVEEVIDSASECDNHRIFLGGWHMYPFYKCPLTLHQRC